MTWPIEKEEKASTILQLPFSSTLKTKLGKELIKLVDKNFLKNGPLNKILNRNTIKISYLCMPNVES